MEPLSVLILLQRLHVFQTYYTASSAASRVSIVESVDHYMR